MTSLACIKLEVFRMQKKMLSTLASNKFALINDSEQSSTHRSGERIQAQVLVQECLD